MSKFFNLWEFSKLLSHLENFVEQSFSLKTTQTMKGIEPNFNKNRFKKIFID